MQANKYVPLQLKMFINVLLWPSKLPTKEKFKIDFMEMVVYYYSAGTN